MYKVIHGFADMKDDGYVYRVGDEFPRLGFSVSDNRIAELLSSTNRLGTPLIAQTHANEVKTEPTETETDELKQIPTEPKKRRKTAKKGE